MYRNFKILRKGNEAQKAINLNLNRKRVRTFQKDTNKLQSGIIPVEKQVNMIQFKASLPNTTLSKELKLNANML